MEQQLTDNLFSLPVEIFLLILGFLTQSEIVQLSLVSSFWQKNCSFLNHNILYFSNKNQPIFSFSGLCKGYAEYNGYKPSIPRLIYVNPEQMIETKESNLLKYLPLMDLSEVHSLAISLSSQYDQFINLILELLETHKFKNLKSLYLHNVQINQLRLDIFSTQLDLKCLYFNSCSWSGDLTLSRRGLISLEKFTVLCKLCIKFNEHHADFDIPDTLKYLILDIKKGKFTLEAHMNIYAERCQGLRNIETKCYFSDLRFCLFVPTVVYQTTKHSTSNTKGCLHIVPLDVKTISELNVKNRPTILSEIAMNQWLDGQ